MPFVNPLPEAPEAPEVDETAVAVTGSSPVSQDDASSDASSWAVAAAALRRDNTLGSYLIDLNYRPKPSDLANPWGYGFNPLEYVPEDLEEHWAKYQGLPSPDAANKLTAKLRQEERDLRTLGDAGWEGVAWTIAAGFADPINYIPVFGAFNWVNRGVTAANRVARAAAASASVGLATSAASEVALQATQETRTVPESVINIIGGTLVSSVLGTSITALSKPQRDAFIDYVRQTMRRTPEDGLKDQFNSAAIVEELGKLPPMDDLPEAAENIIFGDKSGLNSFMTPIARLKSSPIPEAREAVDALANHRLLSEGNVKRNTANPIPAEAEIEAQVRGLYATAHREHVTAYKAARGRIPNQRMRNRFNAWVGRAMRRGDTVTEDMDVPSEWVGAVERSARGWRKLLVQAVNARAQKVGYLPDELTVATADSYFPRSYSIDAIRDGHEDWIALLTQNLGDDVRTAYSVDRVIKQAPNGRLLTRGIDEDAVKEAADARTLNISDYIIEPYLNDDVEQVMMRYLRTYVPPVSIREKFDYDDWLVRLDEGIDRYKADNPTKKEADWADKQRNAIVNDVKLLVNRLLGQDNMPSDATASMFNRTGKAVRAWTGAVQLGGQTLSAIPDLATVVMQQHMGPSLKAFTARFASSEFRKLSRIELGSIGLGTDNLLHSRSFALIYGDEGMLAEGASRVGQLLSRETSRITGMSMWNSILKRWAGTAAQTRMLDSIEALAEGVSIPNVERARLAQMSIDAPMAKRIAAQSIEHSYKHSTGARLAQTAKWTDPEAAHVFELATLREADLTIVTPGVGDRPAFTSNEFGKFMAQFKSFAFGAQNQIIRPALQRARAGDVSNVITGVFALLTLGIVSDMVKKAVKGEDLDDYFDESPQELVKTAMDASGLLGTWGTGYDVVDRVTGGALSEDVMDTDVPWYIARPQSLARLSPAGGMLESAWMTAQTAVDKPGMDTLYNMYKMMPFQNWAVLRAVAEAFDVDRTDFGVSPPRARRTRTERTD